MSVHNSVSEVAITAYFIGNLLLITYERKQLWRCGLHHRNARVEAVKNLPTINSYAAGKCCFKTPYKSLWGHKKHTFPAEHAPEFGHALLPQFPVTAHVSSLLILGRRYQTKSFRPALGWFLAFLFRCLAYPDALWALSRCWTLSDCFALSCGSLVGADTT